MQAYYWGQLAFEENHPSASLLCSECAYVTAKSYLLGDGVLRDINQAYHWARLSREHQYPLSEILCYALFNFYDATPLNGTQERLSCEKSTVSLVGKLPFTSLQT
jgi:TPR repeat protein